MQSKRGAYGAVVVLIGVVIALAGAIAFNGAGASEIIHLALGVGFLLIAAAVFDFPQPPALTWIFAIGIGLLGALFLLQGISDLVHFEPLAGLVYGTLGGPPERILGYVFIAWCLALVILNSRGPWRWIGIVVLLIVALTEAYSFSVAFAGESPNPALKFLYLPLIAWLGLLSRRRKQLLD